MGILKMSKEKAEFPLSPAQKRVQDIIAALYPLLCLKA